MIFLKIMEAKSVEYIDKYYTKIIKKVFCAVVVIEPWTIDFFQASNL